MSVFLLELSVRGPNGELEKSSVSGDLDSSTWYCCSNDLYNFLSEPARLPSEGISHFQEMSKEIQEKASIRP